MALQLPWPSVLDVSITGKLIRPRLFNCGMKSSISSKRADFRVTTICASSSTSMAAKKQVWIWTENMQVMTAAVERGWTTFIFSSRHRQLASDWSSIALINPLFIEEGVVFNSENQRIATFSDISSSQQLEQLQPLDELSQNVIVDLLDWQVIPAENIVAAFQGSHKTVFAISKTPSEAQTFLEALELGLGGVVLKVEDVKAILELKEYFDRRSEIGSLLDLTKATVTRVQVTGMGDRVCVDLCSLMQPGEGLLVGSFARGLFLVHSECLESNYISSRPFRVNAAELENLGSIMNCSFAWEAASEAILTGRNQWMQEDLCHLVLFMQWQEEKNDGEQLSCVFGPFGEQLPENVEISVHKLKGPVHAYVAVPGGKTSYLSELKAGKEVIVVDQSGKVRTAIVGRVKIETRPLIIVEAKVDLDNDTFYSILVQNAETVALISPGQGHEKKRVAVAVTSLKVGDEVLLRIQGGARHTGIEIQEFIVEK